MQRPRLATCSSRGFEKRGCKLIQEFGEPQAGVEFRLRPGGYAIVRDEAGLVATVRTPEGLFLPGGGQDENESPESAAIRETREESGLVIRLLARVGMADQLVFAAADGRHYRKRCTFFLAEPIGHAAACEVDHELLWVPSAAALDSLALECDRWAVERSCR